MVSPSGQDAYLDNGIMSSHHKLLKEGNPYLYCYINYILHHYILPYVIFVREAQPCSI